MKHLIITTLIILCGLAACAQDTTIKTHTIYGSRLKETPSIILEDTVFSKEVLLRDTLHLQKIKNSFKRPLNKKYKLK